MGFGRGIQVPIWALLLTVCFAQQEAFQATTPPGKVTIIQPMTTNPVITTLNPAHNERVCSTWGNFHFKTFDGDIFHFPGLCNYVFASHCNAAYEDFNIQIRRTLIGNVPTISHIIMKLEGAIIEITKDSVLVDGSRVQLPSSHSGILIEKNNIYITVRAKMGLLFMWNEDDSILLEVAEKYANQTCGLCGDFNGIPTYNEFFSNNIQLSALQFGNMQKLDGPTEQCEDPTSNTVDNCTIDYENMCRKTLTGPAFSECNDLLDVSKYIESCVQDLCRCDQSNNAFCMCNTFAEYSRQCAHAGGQPQNWRTPQLCPKMCTFNMHHQECGSPCIDTCSNPETSPLCEEHCIDGCFCPPGTVFDDITTSGCIPLQQCSCTYNGNTYAPGTSYSGACHTCTCTGGKWNCEDIPCPGTCSIVGGSHISTYDEKHYKVHGDCTYVLSRDCENDTFTILGELRKCGLTDTETCLKMIALITNKEQTIIVIKPDGGVFLNSFYTQLPISTADVTIFRPSSFFVIVHTNFGLQMEIQVTPFMQVFVRLDPSLKGRTCGLCGNFNNAQLDDFKIISGVVEGTGAAFANTWKTKASCTDIKNSFENPCSLSVENEKYALHWCGMLTNRTGPFAACHATVNPTSYHTNCMFDTCNCEKSEDCMCASLSAYMRACAAKGVLLSGWRTNICSKYTTCPKSLSYSYVISSCQPTCQSLSEPDVTCNIKFVPVDGCTCVNDTYMDESGKCVPASRCPCYYKGSLVPSGEVIHEDGHVCTCVKGVLNCIGTKTAEPVCISPMVYFDCKNITAGTTEVECQKSCQTLDMHCYRTQCVSGCMCPSGLVSDGKGGCITQEECPCVHNEAMYKPGEKIKVGCNTCECKNRMWSCTKHQCLGTCAVYGDGHYITFDDKRFSFNGNCEYTLVQDHCGINGTANGTFRVITENIPCGTTGTTCSKSIKVFLGNYELILNEEHFQAVKRGDGQEVPYKVHYMGMYLVIETVSGLHLMWDKKTSIFIKLSPDFKGQVCGLCGNYDDNDINDFTTRSQSVVGDVLEFGNSWKISSSCPDAKCVKNPCSTNPYRKSWAEKQCSIINSDVFSACHPQVDAKKYYDSCVTDACACDSGGDCECFCTAVAAYAQVCSEFGVCVAWRTPSICPMFCDYYNPKGECEWHYKPCGAPCMKTCRNPTGRCLNQFSGLEGCYPTCSPDKPYFNEHTMNCTDTCGCYDDLGKYVEPGKTYYLRDNCQLCKCTQEGKINCVYEETACYCIYEGKKYEYNEVIYNTTDGTGGCFSAVCDVNGTITRHIYICNTPTTTHPFNFSTPTTSVTGTTAIPTATTVCVHRVCEWSEWYDTSHPTSASSNGDYETFTNLINKGHKICKTPNDVECRAAQYPDMSLKDLNQKPAITISTLAPTTTLATSRTKPAVSIITRSPVSQLPQGQASTVSTLSPLVSTTPGGSSIFSTSTQYSTTGGIVRTEETSSSTASRTTECFCHVFDQLFSPGQVVYNRTDSSGCYFYALCNDKCEIDRYQGPCPTISSISSTTSPTTSGLSSPESVSSTISPSPETSTPPPEGCPSLDPPRKINETWMSDKCTKATCVGNNTVVLELPPPAEVITCVNGLEPVKIYEPDGCTYHYECECVCNGWSNSGYKTFDGVEYTFSGLCRYVLVKEIVPKYNFSVLTDNYNCDVVGELSCPKSIIVNYNSMEIVLSSQTHEGNVTNKIFFNKEPINESISKDGVFVTRVGKDLTVEIPAINAYISLNGFIFTVKVPFSLFAHNTEGQCGTCSNIKTDECRMQGGQEVSSCSEMAYTWKAENGNNPYCQETTTPSPPPTSLTTPICISSLPLCELILSDIFAECHKILPPRKFYTECLNESCENNSDSLPCIILDKYSSLCIANGICTDWRSKTQGKCSYSCPPDKVYKACGPQKPVTCNERTGNQTIEGFVEGCFCPDGTILFNSFADVCVPECGCVGPDGLPRDPGSKWKSNCQECVCDKKSMTVQCKPLSCQTPMPATCNKPGFIPMPVLTPDNPCCPEIICRCDITLCPKTKPNCERGYDLVSVVSDGNCCVTYECGKYLSPLLLTLLRNNTCIVNGVPYEAGMLVPSDPCKNCTCSSVVDPISKQNIVQCEPVNCHTSCPSGYEYKKKYGECCGECVQVACLISLDNSTSQVLKPGDTWTPQNNKCIFYECDKIEDQLITVEVRTPCPAFNPHECKPEDVQLTADGCCKICKSDSCKVHKKPTVIYQDECKSSKSIELTYCEGFCGSSSKYSLEANQMQHQCTCCQELKSHRRQVTLTCHNGTRTNYDYIYVEECQCITACSPSESEDRTKQLQSRQIN
ncbi:PREDICTED: mucin-5B-like [Gavialis gangeticus]|uniref:mucin-5B-like n=1 Tax=Gavialis gangeticus TaxID=94835 RepID=UPI00092E7A7B|nr:PREDICTED: mucin-5B-like [Gavialis gangeticus]